MNRFVGLCFLLTLFTATAFAEDLIIESRKEGQNNDKYRDEGVWVDSNVPADTCKSAAPGLTPQGQCGSRKLSFDFTSGGQAGRTGTARFSPQFTAPGRYHVYMTWPKAANAGPLNVEIQHAKGRETRVVVQDGWGSSGNRNPNKWIELGEYDFAAGADQYVELQVTAEAKAIDSRTGGQAIADAVRFSSTPITATPAPPAQAGVQSTAAVPAPGASTLPDLREIRVVESSPPRPLKWLTGIAEARKEAESSDRKILVYFFAPESERSRHFDSVFEQVSSILGEKYVTVKINMAQNQTLAAQLNVFRGGTINIYDSKGQPVDQITERITAEEMRTKLQAY